MRQGHYTRFSAHSPLIAVAVWMQTHGIWKFIAEEVSIPQKVIRYLPIDKLLGVLVTILAGAGGLVEANTRVRPDRAVCRAFGLDPFPDQSTLSETVNACTEESVVAMRRCLTEVYRYYGRAVRHKPRDGWLILDVDLTGMPCGGQGEGATKGYFSGSPGLRGRQLGRVVAAGYDEIVFQALYPGKKQLSQAFCPLVAAAAEVLGVDKDLRRRRNTLLRCDAGGGTEREINWALEQGYGVLTKLKSHQRTQKLMRSVSQWYPDPKVPGRQVGWVEQPHPFARPTMQVAIRTVHADPNKKPTERVLVTSLTRAEVVSLMGWPAKMSSDPAQVALAVAHLYDQRGGGAETQNRNDKQGLGLTKRNKKRFLAQVMLVLLAELAHNLLIWIRDLWTQVDPGWRRWGHLRLVRDVFHIPGKLELDTHGKPYRLALSRDHPLSGPLIEPLRTLVGSELVIILDEI